MAPKEREFHASYKPSWGPGTTLVYSIPGKVGISQTKSTQTDPILQEKCYRVRREGHSLCENRGCCSSKRISSYLPLLCLYIHILYSLRHKPSLNNAPIQQSR